MIITEFLELIDYKITDGGRYYWSCFGPDAWTFECLGYHDYHFDDSVSVTFDNKTLEVYSIHSNHHSWYHPDYFAAYCQEAKDRNVDYTIAWDDTIVDFVDLDKMISLVKEFNAFIIAEEVMYD